MSLLAIIYDKIIANRLIKWLKISYEQSAFQKGKSTTTQLFLLHLIIALAKKNNVTLYIGLFDISKALDKISRLKMLTFLLSLGIGMYMFNAIKKLFVLRLVSNF